MKLTSPAAVPKLREFYRRTYLRARGIAEALAATVLGYDVFISYSWRDGRTYAKALRTALARRYRVFLDDSELYGGLQLSSNLGLALRRSSALAMIVTPDALDSPHVQDELRAFDQLGRPLIPINIGDQLRRRPGSRNVHAEHGPPNTIRLLGERIWINETADRLAIGPTDEVVDRLKKAFISVRRGRIQAILSTIAILVFATVAALAIYQREVARAQRDRMTAEALAGAASARTKTEPELASLLAAAAFDTDPAEVSYSALLETVAGQGRAAGYGSIGDAVVASLNFTGPQSLFSVSETGKGQRWSLAPDGSLSPNGPELNLTSDVSPHLVRVISIPGSPHVVVVSGTIPPLGQKAQPGNKGGPMLWDFETGAVAESQPYRDLLDRSIAAHAGSGSFFGIDQNGEVRQAPVSAGDLRHVKSPIGGPFSAPLAVAARQPVVAALNGSDTERSIIVWDYETGAIKGQIKLKPGLQPDALGLSPSGEYVAIEDAASTGFGCSPCAGVSVWRVETGRPFSLTVPLPGAKLEHFAFDPEQQRIAVSISHQLVYEGGKGTVDHEIWLYQFDKPDWAPQRLQAPQGERFWVNAMTFGPDGRFMASGDRSGRLIVWQLEPKHVLARALDTGEERAVASAFGHGVTGLRFSPDGTFLAAGFESGRAISWELSSARNLGTTFRPGAVADLAFTGQSLVVINAESALPRSDRLQALAIRQVGGQFALDQSSHTDSASVLPFHTRGKGALAPARAHLAPGGGTLIFEDEGQLRAWRRYGVDQRQLGPVSNGDQIEFSGDGSTVSTRGADGSVRIADLISGRSSKVRAKRSLRGGGPEAIALNYDGSTLAFSEQGQIRIWDLRRDVEVLQGVPMRVNDTNGVHFLAFDRSGQRLASAGYDGTIRVWSASTGAQIGPVLEPQEGDFTAFAITPSGTRLASGHRSGRVILMDIMPDALRKRTCRLAGRALTDAEQVRFLGASGLAGEPCHFAK
jgi:WD40 repeat protein